MTERALLLTEISQIIQDYRFGEIAIPNAAHVDRWINQFDDAAQLGVLFETKRILDRTYITRENFLDFLTRTLHDDTIAGNNPNEFWKSVNFLRVQRNGNSQNDILTLLNGLLLTEFGYGLAECAQQSNHFVYLDDIIFTGSRVKNDLTQWILNEAPSNAIVYILAIANYTGSYYQINRIRQASIQSNKNINIRLVPLIELENRLTHKDNSDVLWPTYMPPYQDVQDYASSTPNFRFAPRQPVVPFNDVIFSSENSRVNFEHHMLSAGVRIRGYCNNPGDTIRPLGFGSFGFGFGATVITYRNCPNNTPLAFWWGDPQAHFGSPLRRWYPLLPRKVYH